MCVGFSFVEPSSRRAVEPRFTQGAGAAGAASPRRRFGPELGDAGDAEPGAARKAIKFKYISLRERHEKSIFLFLPFFFFPFLKNLNQEREGERDREQREGMAHYFDVHGSSSDNADFPHALSWTRGDGPHGLPCIAVATGMQVTAWNCFLHGGKLGADQAATGVEGGEDEGLGEGSSSSPSQSSSPSTAPSRRRNTSIPYKVNASFHIEVPDPWKFYAHVTGEVDSWGSHPSLPQEGVLIDALRDANQESMPRDSRRAFTGAAFCAVEWSPACFGDAMSPRASIGGLYTRRPHWCLRC